VPCSRITATSGRFFRKGMKRLMPPDLGQQGGVNKPVPLRSLPAGGFDAMTGA
jgi:hypothetical protein